MASYSYFIHLVRRFQENNNDIFAINSGDKGSGKSTLSIHLAREYIKKYGFICPYCGGEFYKNLYKHEKIDNSMRFFIPDEIKNGEIKIQCPEQYELNLSTGQKEKISGCGKTFTWSERKRIKWEADKFIAYDNKDATRKMLKMPRYSPLIFDEAMNFMCLTDDVLIKMPRDIKKYPYGVPIKNLVGKKDFYVYSYNNKNKKLELSKCKGCYYIRDDSVYEVTLSNGEKIKCTLDHKFVTSENKIKTLKELIWFKSGLSKRYVQKRKNIIPQGKTKLLGSKKLLYEFSDRLIYFSEGLTVGRNNIKTNLSGGGHGLYIKNIKFVGKKPVYSLIEVEKNHNYFANNVLVMNSGSDHNKTESKELKKLFTVIRPRRLFMMGNIPELTWIDSKYREIMSHFWIYCINKGVAFIFEKDKAVTKDKWHLKELSKTLGTIKYFTSIDKIKNKIKKHPCYFDTITWSELPEKVYDEYEYVRNAHNLRRQVEEMEISNNDLAKIMSYNLMYNWDRIHNEVIKSKKNSITYNILKNEILLNPVSKKSMASETTIRNWLNGVEQFIKTKGENAQFIQKSI